MKNLSIPALILCGLFILSPDKELFATASVVLLFLMKFSWRDNEPKVLFIGMIFYWLTVCTLLVYGAVFNKPMIQQTLVPDTFVFTTYLALAATFVYNSAIFLVIRKVKINKLSIVFSELKQYDAKKLLLFYCIFSFSWGILGVTIFSFGGLSQFALGLLWIKWAFLTFLIMHTVLFPSNQKFVYIILLIEIALSLTGFWSSFKDYLFIAAASFLTFSIVMNTRRVILVLFLGFSAFFIMVLWTVVKGEYRQFLTGGDRSFTIEETDKAKNLEKLSDLVNNNFGEEKFSDKFQGGVEALANRINYTEYFAMAVGQVPEVIPYENGALLEGGFEHVFKPRVFFPDKAIIDDSYITSKYTGRQFTGAEQGASFSLGSVAERYIDYGPYFMFIPVFGFGLIIGFIYKYIYTNSLNHVWGMSLVAPLLFLIPNLGVATTKFLGWTFTYFIVWFVFKKFALKDLDRYLRYSDD